MKTEIQQFISFALLAICFGSFAWGMQKLFTVPKPVPRLVLVIKIFGTGFALASAYLLFNETRPLATIYVGWAFYIAGTLLFWLTYKSSKAIRFAFAFVDAPQELIFRKGPFRWIRHPFYSSYLLGWIGSVFISDHILLKLALAFMGFLYWKAATEEEAGFLRSELKSEYASYRSNVGKFIPRFF
jgi:protein-S-isoprenylcysteine O-methyltransferase Ste14